MKWLRGNTMIYPLSADPKLNKKNVLGLKHYFAHLRAAFKHERIWNIGISGARGTGKSSLLASFDRMRFWHFRRQKYLYVNLGEYANPDVTMPDTFADPTPVASDESVPTEKQGTGPLQQKVPDAEQNRKAHQDSRSTAQQKAIQDQNAIEKRIMLQLCSRFKDKYLLGIHGVPEPSWIATALFVVFVLCIVVLLLKPPLAAVIAGIDSTLPNLMQNFIKYNDLIEAGMYALILTIGGLGLACTYKWWSTRIVGMKLAFKAADAEMELDGKPQSQDYLDQYAQELVYCLCSIRRKIDYTVVFEDMDRLDADICIPIFTRLRELNHMVNARLQQNRHLPFGGGHKIRFVYLVDDHIVNTMVYHKFFDYLLPIAPTLNANSISVVFREKLKVLNKELIRECGVVDCGCNTTFSVRIARVFSKVTGWIKEKRPVAELSNKVAGKSASAPEQSNDADAQKAKDPLEQLLSNCMDLSNHIVPILNTPIVDYRMIYTILNEYALMVKLYWTNNQSVKKMFKQYWTEKLSVINMFKLYRTNNQSLKKMFEKYLADIQPPFLTNNLLEKIEADFAKCSQRILAFSVYKHLYPEDYQKALRMDDCILIRGTVEVIDDEKKRCLNELLRNGILTIRNLHYAGFPKEKCRELWRKQFEISREKSGRERMITLIHALERDDPLDIKMVKDVCKACDTTINDLPVDVLAEAVSLVYESGDIDDQQDWFFVNRKPQICLDVLGKLGVKGLRFILRCKKEDKKRNIFKQCLDETDTIANNALTRAQAMCYALGAAEDQVSRGGMILKNENELTRFSTLKRDAIAMVNNE